MSRYMDLRTDEDGKKWIMLPESAGEERIELVRSFAHLGSVLHVSQSLMHGARRKAAKTTAASANLAGPAFTSKDLPPYQMLS